MYAILPRWTKETLTLKDLTGVKSVVLLGSPIPIAFQSTEKGTTLELPDLPEELRQQPAWVLKVSR